MKMYWQIMLGFSSLVVFFKIALQQNLFYLIFPGEVFLQVTDKYKVGVAVLNKNKNQINIIPYVIWDILVALAIVLHQHYLIMVGLWHTREDDIEQLEAAEERLKEYLKIDIRNESFYKKNKSPKAKNTQQQDESHEEFKDVDRESLKNRKLRHGSSVTRRSKTSPKRSPLKLKQRHSIHENKNESFKFTKIPLIGRSSVKLLRHLGQTQLLGNEERKEQNYNQLVINQSDECIS